ncbi:hypothetical protein CAP48_12275 [Advenella sp. S44]|nr:hypothetical protein CAP48_12275 [Advenella sp. S44]
MITVGADGGMIAMGIQTVIPTTTIKTVVIVAEAIIADSSNCPACSNSWRGPMGACMPAPAGPVTG